MNPSDIRPVAPRHFWIDHLDPWMVHTSGKFGIRWYGLAYLAGILIAALAFMRWARQDRLPIATDEVGTLIAYAATGVVFGGRIGYCIFYNLHEVLLHPLEIFAVWHGGMASHGGILGLVLAICLFAWRGRLDPWIFLDAAAAIGPVGVFFGRLANFANGELWGRPSRVAWAVIFPEAPLVGGVNVPRHPSQLYAAIIEGLLVLAVGQWVFHRQLRSGITTAAVCVAYGVGRFIDEFWRQPDLGQPVFWGWMSKGQLLTIPMILAGIGIALWRRQLASPSRVNCKHDT